MSNPYFSSPALTASPYSANAGAAGGRSPGASSSGYNSRPFMTPWLDYASVAVPENHSLVMWWAQYLWLIDGNYRTAMERVAAHFLTVLEFPDLEADEESAWKDLFTNEMDSHRELMGCAYDFLCYGNIIASLYLPFKRFLQCRKCHSEQPIERVNYTLALSDSKPYVQFKRRGARGCPVCGNKGNYEVRDRRDPDLARVRVNRYDAADIELAFNRYSQKKEIYWRIPEEDRRDILSKARIHIDETPMDVLEAVAAGGRLRFNSELVYHASEPTISGVHTRGWGLPRSISNFRTAWLQQLTNKMDQAVAIDYTLGMRILSPSATNGGDDPMKIAGMESFTARMKGMVNEHRNNPASYHVSPYPVEYQFLGGEGNSLMPPEKLKFRQQEYLNQLGVPLEYHQMNLTTQAAPMSLRLFESYWQVIPTFYNQILDWIVDVMSRVYNLEPTKVQMQKTTIADDAERKQVLLQLMSANQLSPQTALQPYGVNAHEEVKKVMAHQEYVDRMQQEADEKLMKQEEMGALKGMTGQPTPSAMAQQGAAGDPAAALAGGMGGMPMGGMPGAVGQAPASLDEMSGQAQEIAQQLVVMPEYNRKQELKALREGNKDLHALVMQNMEQIRRQASSEGQQMILSQGGTA